MKHALQFWLSVWVLAQYGEPASGTHSVVPPPQFVPHMLLEQTWPIGQTLPQVPQFSLSVSVVAQYGPASPTQSDWPIPHDDVQLPLTQTEPSAHVTPHLPQLFGSTFVSKHELPHCVVPGPQLVAQLPAEQTKPPLHTVPQAPQFIGS